MRTESRDQICGLNPLLPDPSKRAAGVFEQVVKSLPSAPRQAPCYSAPLAASPPTGMKQRKFQQLSAHSCNRHSGLPICRFITKVDILRECSGDHVPSLSSPLSPANEVCMQIGAKIKVLASWDLGKIPDEEHRPDMVTPSCTAVQSTAGHRL
jgi:hypothetical protein